MDNCYWERLLFFLYQALIASGECPNLADCHGCVETRLGTVTQCSSPPGRGLCHTWLTFPGSKTAQLLNTGRPSCNHVDEVWPNLFLGDLVTAHNRFVLWKMGVTHVLNAAHGTSYSHGGQDFYGATIDYYGVPAHDLPSFDISQFFFSAAQFIHNALNTPGAKILVHCAVGVSRSATLVLAYLMINHHLPLVEAIKTVKEHRWISPNRGFLKHLRNLDGREEHRVKLSQ
uniref:Dual specificity protein phosphatase n=1 Tax=Serinus canaria TaxID=9135 RepID=A0A8C9MGR5_SERCA